MFLRIFSIFSLIFITSVCHSYAYKLSNDESIGFSNDVIFTTGYDELTERMNKILDFEKTGAVICGDRKLEIKTENTDNIIVEFSKKGIEDWESYTKSFPKVIEQEDKKIYFAGLEDEYKTIIVNDNGKWELLGGINWVADICSAGYAEDVLEYKCPKIFGLQVNIIDYADKIIVAQVLNCSSDSSKCEELKAIVLVRDKNITDRDVFINGDLRIERTNNSWVIDEKLCE